MTTKLPEMTWEDVKEYLSHDERIMIPVGSTEQHGVFAPLGTDTMVALSLAEDAANKTGVLVTPPLWFGWSPHHMVLPGTITIRPMVLSELLFDVIRSLCAHGFRKFVVINGHRIVNIPWMQIAASQAQEELKVKVAIFDPAYMSKEVAKNLGFGKVGHAEEIEISHMLYKKPELIKKDKIAHDHVPPEKNLYYIDPADARDTLCYVPSTLEDQKRLVEATGDAISGRPSQASAEKGKLYHEHLVNRLVMVLKEL